MASRPSISSLIGLEGTTLEGGGQLLRIALGLSTLTQKPIRITNIRGRRSGGGGLKSQHLTCVQWLGKACNAQLIGARLKSKEITFIPSTQLNSNTEIEAGEIRICQSTPGSINLVLQAILPCILFSGINRPIRIQITGGTNVSNSPSVNYIDQVLFPMLELIGIPHIEMRMHSRGWSQGSIQLGSVTCILNPLQNRLPAFHLTDRGEIRNIRATVVAPRKTEQAFRDKLHGMFERRETCLFGVTSHEIDFAVSFEDSRHEKRYYLLLVATTVTGMRLGRDWLYNRGVHPGKSGNIISTMAKKVWDDLIAEIEHGGCVDEFLRDQLIVFQALAEGKSKVYGGKKKELVEPSLHTKTAMWVVNKILGVDLRDENGGHGIGLHPGKDETSDEHAVLNVSDSQRGSPAQRRAGMGQ